MHHQGWSITIDTQVQGACVSVAPTDSEDLGHIRSGYRMTGRLSVTAVALTASERVFRKQGRDNSKLPEDTATCPRRCLHMRNVSADSGGVQARARPGTGSKSVSRTSRDVGLTCVVKLLRPSTAS